MTARREVRLRPGAYGLAFAGVGRPATLQSAPDGWRSVSVAREATGVGGAVQDEDEVSVTIDADRAEVRVGCTTRVLLDRASRTAHYRTTAPIPDDELAHPYLGLTASYFAMWDGRFAFHTGAFVAAGRAWGIVGPKEAGKSTLLGHLHLRGVPVLADDILVVSREVCFAGPRSIDLRPPAASGLLGPDAAVPAARNGTRRRLVLPPIEPEVPFGGWVYLGWGDGIGVTSLPPSERLHRVNETRIIRSTGDDPRQLLDFATAPAWELLRPRRWEALGEVADRLLDAVAG